MDPQLVVKRLLEDVNIPGYGDESKPDEFSAAATLTVDDMADLITDSDDVVVACHDLVYAILAIPQIKAASDQAGPQSNKFLNAVVAALTPAIRSTFAVAIDNGLDA